MHLPLRPYLLLLLLLQFPLKPPPYKISTTTKSALGQAAKPAQLTPLTSASPASTGSTPKWSMDNVCVGGTTSRNPVHQANANSASLRVVLPVFLAICTSATDAPTPPQPSTTDSVSVRLGSPSAPMACANPVISADAWTASMHLLWTVQSAEPTSCSRPSELVPAAIPPLRSTNRESAQSVRLTAAIPVIRTMPQSASNASLVSPKSAPISAHAANRA